MSRCIDEQFFPKRPGGHHAVRSRRLREAVGESSPSVTGGIAAELDEQIAIASRLMHSAAEPGAIADAIEAIPADEWDDATLTALRSTALDIGRLLRAIAAVAESDGS